MNIQKYIWMSAVALALASCSQNDELAQSGEFATKHVVFTANVESGMKTRAVTDPKDAVPTRALLEIYDESGNLVDGKQIPGTLNAEKTAFTFSADLDGLQKTYTCVFWADTEGTYNTTSLKSISYQNISNVEQGIAFSANCTINPAEDKEVEVTLRHAVAKLVLHETGTGLKANDVVGAKFTRPNYTFDASTNTYTADATTTETPLKLSYTVASDEETGDLTAAYMLVPASVVVNGGVTLYYGSEEHSKNIANVPLKTNYRTLLQGAFEDLGVSGQTFNITCDTNWEEHEHSFPEATVDPATNTITTNYSGQIANNPDLLAKAISKYGALSISGPMNDDDIKTVSSYLKTLDDSKEISLTLTGASFESLPDAAFKDAKSLTFIYLPTTLKTIGNSAFEGCAKLSGIDGLQNVETVGQKAFKDVYTDRSVGGTQITLLLYNATSIGANAFAGAAIDRNLRLDLLSEEDIDVTDAFKNEDGTTMSERVILFLNETKRGNGEVSDDYKTWKGYTFSSIGHYTPQ